MKKYLLLIAFITFSFSFSQNDETGETAEIDQTADSTLISVKSAV